MEEQITLIELDAQRDTASCNVCYARNYESARDDAIGEKVNRLYKLGIGHTGIMLCDACLDRLSDMLNYARRLRDHTLRAGDEVWVLERDEDGLACDVSGYMFLAEAGGRAIVTAYINDMDDLDGIMEYHVMETAESYNTDLYVFPMADCYADREKALEILHEEKGEDDAEV